MNTRLANFMKNRIISKSSKEFRSSIANNTNKCASWANYTRQETLQLSNSQAKTIKKTNQSQSKFQEFTKLQNPKPKKSSPFLKGLSISEKLIFHLCSSNIQIISASMKCSYQNTGSFFRICRFQMWLRFSKWKNSKNWKNQKNITFFKEHQ